MSGIMSAGVIVELIEDRPDTYDEFWRTHDRNLNGDDVYRRYRDRFQPFRWRAKSAGNGEIMARGESYFNRQDALDAINLLFGPVTSVVLRAGGVESYVRAVEV